MLLVFQPREGTLVNQWAADHTHAVAGGVPILALDMYEHAYHLDHGAAAGAYVDAFMGNINWDAVYERYQLAVHTASEPLAADADALQDAMVRSCRGGRLGCRVARRQAGGRVLRVRS
jgi:Fe-Mn family superoxide dismutase